MLIAAQINTNNQFFNIYHNYILINKFKLILCQTFNNLILQLNIQLLMWKIKLQKAIYLI